VAARKKINAGILQAWREGIPGCELPLGRTVEGSGAVPVSGSITARREKKKGTPGICKNHEKDRQQKKGLRKHPEKVMKADRKEKNVNRVNSGQR